MNVSATSQAVMTTTDNRTARANFHRSLLLIRLLLSANLHVMDENHTAASDTPPTERQDMSGLLIAEFNSIFG
jgi:hypothetical protein